MKRIVGAHVSTSGGLEKACERAAKIGANGIQIFTGSPRVWKGKSVDDYGVAGLKEAALANGVEYVVIHATYLINLASDKRELVDKSVESLVNDLKIADKLARELEEKAVGVVVHLGSHQGRGYEAMREQLVSEVDRVLSQSAGAERSVLLIENSAGQNGKIASDLEEVKDLVGSGDGTRLGWCVDTCHAHAAGYGLGEGRVNELAEKEEVVQMGLLESGGKNGENGVEGRMLADEIGRLGLWEKLALVHVNESRDKFGSGRDRHANLGEGEIGEDNLKVFLSQAEVGSKTLVLEVPGFDNKGPDRENVERLKKLAGV